MRRRLRRLPPVANEAKTRRQAHCRTGGSSRYLPRKRDAWRAQARLLDRLRDRPCADCGGRFAPCAMDFDHRDPRYQTGSRDADDRPRRHGIGYWTRSRSAISCARTAIGSRTFERRTAAIRCGSSSVGGAPAFQAACRGFEPRLPLQSHADWDIRARSSEPPGSPVRRSGWSPDGERTTVTNNLIWMTPASWRRPGAFMPHRNLEVGGRPRSIRSNVRRSSRVPLATAAALVLAIGGVLSALPVLAAAPNVREVTPAGITIDGSRADWDDPSADFLADMYEAGKPDHPILAKLYGRYDCASRTFYVHITTVSGWVVIPSDPDNYVKQGQTDKLVDGDDGPGPPPAFAYISKDGWEASFAFAPGTYTGEAGLNVHALVAPEERRHRRQRSRTAGWMSPSSVQSRHRLRQPPPRAAPTPVRLRGALRAAQPERVHRAFRPAERERVVEPSALPTRARPPRCRARARRSNPPPCRARAQVPRRVPSQWVRGAVGRSADHRHQGRRSGNSVDRRRRGGRGSTVRAPA